ncbi:MAG TPA: phenylalanine--tRNA ligase beta subunit-related protein [Candidatus Limnocylindrales bacterium]|nr:phenylalanine--tRNA ligase beta subunit-related protein [Candidatus Limnocylindrales bacterium]
MSTFRFAYDPGVAARFPAVAGGVIHAVGVSNGPSSAALTDAFRVEQEQVRARIGDTPLSEIPTLAAWRRAFRGFGVDPTAYRSAAEALLRRLTKQGSLPSINALVDIGNLVAIRYGLPVAMFDQRTVSDGTTVCFADGSERFTDLGSGEVESPEPGEVIFIDEAGLVSARRWCWRQSAESASGPETTEVLVTVEGHHEAAVPDVSAAIADLQLLLRMHAQPEALASGIVTAGQPGFAGLGR